MGRRQSLGAVPEVGTCLSRSYPQSIARPLRRYPMIKWKNVKNFRSLKIKIRQVYYSEDHLASLMRGAIPYFNGTTNHYLENQVMADCYHQGDYLDCDYYGVFSWRFEEKYMRDHQQIGSLVAADEGQADAYGFLRGTSRDREMWRRMFQRISHDPMGVKRFLRQTNDMNVWQQAVQLGGHPAYLVETAQKIFNLLGYSLDICLVKTKPVFSNHWLVKPEIFEAYVKGLLLPAMQIMENNEEIKALCYQDSNYAQTVRRDEKREPLSPEQC